MDEKGAASMPSERTPLLQTVPVDEPHDRYPHHRIKRFCTVALIAIPFTTLLIIFIAVGIGGENDLLGDHGDTSFSISRLFAAQNIPLPNSLWPYSSGLSYTQLQDILLETPDPEKAREWSKYYTAGPHLAGKNLSQAEWTRDKWIEFGVPQSEVVAYDVYINYPRDHRLALLKDGAVDFEATLEEDVLDEDPTSGLPDRVPTFHGYSANGNVTAQFVYCNYGTYADFDDLLDAGIDLEGKIAIIRYGGIFRGLKVKRASELGMIGAVIYSDPGDDGGVTEENGFKAYPDGPARNPSSVQRGSTQYLSIAPGDPTTIGYPSKPGCKRQPVDGKFPDIPSLPISYKEALPLLKALNGHGPNATAFSRSAWHSGGLGYKGVHYNIGPTPSGVEINLYNDVEYVINPLWDVIGVINGSISDEVVVIGNHRDAWIAGGAGDPNSGSAVLNEVVRAFGKAVEKGWKPLRTIVFASWDGEEYGLVGSTEWVEEYVPWLRGSAIAYLNVDVAATGTDFHPSASPLLNRALYEVAASVLSPNQTVEGQTVLDTWNGVIRTMGSGSDFTAFQDFAGVSSLDMGYSFGPGGPVYHYHSNYDSFHWMDEYGDPGFKYHIAIAQLWGLLTAKLVEEPVIPFNATDYALGLEKYLDSVKEAAKDSTVDANDFKTELAKLEKAIHKLQAAAVKFDAHAAELASMAQSHAMYSKTTARTLYQQVRRVNTKYKRLERAFLYEPGLDSRKWFKHVVFAPGLWTGYAGATYPGLVEALQFGAKADVVKWTGIIVGRVYAALSLLNGY